MNVYDVESLVKIYPRQAQPANDSLTFSIEEGEFFGLLGDNGAGKTTLVKQMANLLLPTRGYIRLFGEPLNTTALYTPSRIGYMPQSGMALNNLTVSEAIYFTAHLRGLSRPDARRERNRLIERLDLGEIRKRPVTRLSGGQKRLALLSTTLAASPPVLLLDEPTNDLAPQTRVRVWELLREVNTAQGTTIILVTHNVLEAEKVIRRVGIMRQGRLIKIGRPGLLKAELDTQLRLDIVFAPDQPPALPAAVRPQIIAPGYWHVLINREQSPAIIETLLRTPSVEDFRLNTATLEDLYLAVVDSR
jgi:ABC-2 type transport system ATP-binding protein